MEPRRETNTNGTFTNIRSFKFKHGVINNNRNKMKYDRTLTNNRGVV